MDQVTETEVREKVKEKSIHYWRLRECSICDSPIGYIFMSGEAAADVAYDSNCDCVPYHTPLTPSSYSEIAAAFNRQTPEVRKKMWDSFICS